MITLVSPTPAPRAQVHPSKTDLSFPTFARADIKIIIRTTTCDCGYATYRIIPMAVRGEDVGDRREEIHGSGGIIDLLDKVILDTLSFCDKFLLGVSILFSLMAWVALR